MNPVYGITHVINSNGTWTIERYPSDDSNLKQLPTVSKFKYILHDISREDAGRTEDMTMHKNRIGQSVELELGWSYLTLEMAHRVLTVFNDEYIEITYHDTMHNEYQTRWFYVADREVPVYNHTLGLTGEFTITCISKSGEMVKLNPPVQGGGS